MWFACCLSNYSFKAASPTLAHFEQFLRGIDTQRWYLWLCYSLLYDVGCFLTLQKDTNGVVTLKIIPNQQSRHMACEVSKTAAKSISHHTFFLLHFIIIIFYDHKINSSRLTLWSVNMRSNVIWSLLSLSILYPWLN